MAVARPRSEMTVTIPPHHKDDPPPPYPGFPPSFNSACNPAYNPNDTAGGYPHAPPAPPYAAYQNQNLPTNPPPYLSGNTSDPAKQASQASMTPQRQELYASATASQESASGSQEGPSASQESAAASQESASPPQDSPADSGGETSPLVNKHPLPKN